VTRGVLLELAPEEGYHVEEGAFRLSDLAAADEAFTSSSIRELLPVVELDGQSVGEGRPSAAAQELQGALRRIATA
jgi:branched-subunit amino acid aminotransferase/4-amino-4-deoxychorismate lyase